MGHRLILLAALLVAGCLPAERPEPELPPCLVTCDRWRELGCQEGEPTTAGTSCDEVCLATEEFVPIDHQCIQSADSCDAARRCEQ